MVALPSETHRWRCGQCGNLTRFDVRRSVQSVEYWHANLSGHYAIEEVTVEREEIAAVTCRWCGSAASIELVPRVDADSAQA